MKIVFHPHSLERNAYVKHITEALERKGIQVFSLDDILSNKKLFKEISIVHLNWYENLGSHWGFIKKMSRLFYLLFHKKKIIWTLHNKKPHTAKVLYLQKILFKLLCKYASTIIIHSKQSEKIITAQDKSFQKKIVYTPHPNYIDVYGPLRPIQSIHGPLSLIFMGVIKPYKNIELLMEVLNNFDANEVTLTIAGRCPDDNYANQLKLKPSSNNINLEFGYISDDQIATYIQKHDLSILPYDTRSSLNSGTAILSFSYGTSVICPKIGTIEDIKNQDCLITYMYDSQEQHKVALKAAVEKAMLLKKKNTEIFNEWGGILRNEMIKLQDVGIVADVFSQVYKTH
ncbi:MAG: hypothetical protein CL868_19910 [Cytophagaceae bacterium]|mgnify:CR=1 FL=1|nr:hypothetical protein [Cytophagaceae bacterium]|tara:strand:- start:937 stop:1965 length:1029 start_codon:yes stop_codon:yes gene_type:complete